MEYRLKPLPELTWIPIQEFIVDSKSATFDGHPKYGLEVDHFSLNKFDSPTDPNYVQVRAVIVDLYQRVIRGQKWRRVRRQRQEAKMSQRHSAGSWKHTEDQEDAEDVRKEAIRELHDEEARKSAAMRELEYQKRAAEEKRASEQAYCERLKKNMLKYGVTDPDAILRSHPLPPDASLKSSQEIHDKERWHQSILKGLLSSEGLDGGQIDEILNDTGETMMVGGVETAFTRIASKWVSTRTLDRYKIPWQYDQVRDQQFFY